MQQNLKQRNLLNIMIKKVNFEVLAVHDKKTNEKEIRLDLLKLKHCSSNSNSKEIRNNLFVLKDKGISWIQLILHILCLLCMVEKE
jgi:hypothetical protein